MFIQINLKTSFRYTSFYAIELCIFDLFLLYTYTYVYIYIQASGMSNWSTAPFVNYPNHII